MDSYLESISVVGLAHSLQPLGHPLGITVLAPITQLGASRYRVPRRLSPFNCGSDRHLSVLLRNALPKFRSLQVTTRAVELTRTMFPGRSHGILLIYFRLDFRRNFEEHRPAATHCDCSDPPATVPTPLYAGPLFDNRSSMGSSPTPSPTDPFYYPQVWTRARVLMSP
jgi:hypothetical protein